MDKVIFRLLRNQKLLNAVPVMHPKRPGTKHSFISNFSLEIFQVYNSLEIFQVYNSLEIFQVYNSLEIFLVYNSFTYSTV